MNPYQQNDSGYGVPYPQNQGYAQQPSYGAPTAGGYQYPAPQQGSWPAPQTATMPQGGMPQGGMISRPHELPAWMAQGQNTYSQDQMMQWFQAADTNRSGAICAPELQQALAAAGQQYPMEAVTAMIDMFDMDGSGDIDYQEFAGLYNYLQQMSTAFQQSNQAGYVDSTTAEKALFSHPGVASNFASAGLSSLFSGGSSYGSGGKMNYIQFMLLSLAAGKLLTMFQKGGKHKGKHSQQGYGYNMGYNTGYGAQPNMMSMGTQLLGSLFGKHH
jgi:hypothetical protein